MLITLLLALALVSLCRSLPTPPAPLDASNTKEEIFVPYDVKFAPVELDDPALEKQLLNSNAKETATSEPEELNADQKTEPPEDYILVPMSVFKALQDRAIEPGSLKHHLLSKRQAPANGFNVYSPDVQFRSITREKRRVFRPPALVGYLNKYDRFPTVA